MIYAFHLVFGCYGFWLPNDPRGSWSIYVGSRELYEYGEATKVSTKRSLASKSHDSQLRLEAKTALQFDPVQFTGIQARAAGHGIAQAVEEGEYLVYACCIMPDHVHMVVRMQTKKPRQMIGHFKSRATLHMKSEGVYFQGERCPNSPWARGGWCVYIDTRESLSRAVDYVNYNPVREGLPRQSWSFVYKKQ